MVRRFFFGALVALALGGTATAQPHHPKHKTVIAAVTITPQRVRELVATIGLPQTAVCDPVTSTANQSVCLSINPTTGALLTTGSGGSSSLPYSATNTGGQTATTASVLGIGGVFPSTTPSLTGGQFNPLLLDANGNLKVTVNGFTACTPNANNNCTFGIDQVTSGANVISISPTQNTVKMAGSGNFAPGQVTLTSATASLIVATRTGRASVTIVNESTTAIAIGTSGVTYSTGVILPGVIGASITIPVTSAIYGALNATGSALVCYYEVY